MEFADHYLSRDSAIDTMNHLGASRSPFQFLISFSGEHSLVIRPEEAAGMGFHLDMPGWGDSRKYNLEEKTVNLKKNPPDIRTYQKAYREVQKNIHYGNTFLLNLTFPTLIESNYSLEEIFLASMARFKLLLNDYLVVFSPERFVRIQGNTISSHPMKGTLDASVPGAYQELISDPKEEAEHNTIVDLIRNDLSIIARKVRVKRFKYIEKLKTDQGELLQMSSEITGVLPDNFRNSLGEMLFSLLPAGSICGAPKQKTLDIIRRVEGYNRGFYTGIFGYFDGENMDTAVAIRYIEKDGEQLIFKSGGGITFLSDCEKEYHELIRKVYVPIY